MGTQPENTHGIQTQTQPNPYPKFGSGPGITLGYPNFGYPIPTLVQTELCHASAGLFCPGSTSEMLPKLPTNLSACKPASPFQYFLFFSTVHHLTDLNSRNFLWPRLILQARLLLWLGSSPAPVAEVKDCYLQTLQIVYKRNYAKLVPVYSAPALPVKCCPNCPQTYQPASLPALFKALSGLER